MLWAQIHMPDGEDLVAFRDGQRYVPRLAKSRRPRSRPVRIRSDASYLITGGPGALGLRLARWLAERGARHLVLVGRRVELPAPARDTVASLKRLGVRILLVRADVADTREAAELFGKVKAAMPKIGGIFHLAGVFGGFEPLHRLSTDLLEKTCRGKALGAWVLHRLTRNMALDFFVCFSSITSVWGFKKQAHYAVANQFLDVLAHYRRGLGLPALSINWALWKGTGSPEIEKKWALMGMDTLSTEQGMAALGILLDTEAVQTAVAGIDWRLFKPVHQAIRPCPLIESIPVPDPAGSPDPTSTAIRTIGRPADLVSFLSRMTGKVTGLDPSELDAEKPLNEAGLDSLMAVELKNHIQKRLHIETPLKRLIGGETIVSLAAFINDQMGHGKGSAPRDGSEKELVEPGENIRDGQPVNDRAEREWVGLSL